MELLQITIICDSSSLSYVKFYQRHNCATSFLWEKLPADLKESHKVEAVIVKIAFVIV